MVERRLPRWSELSEVIRPRRPSGVFRGLSCFLSSPASRRTTGTHLVVDGALTRGIQL